MEKEKALLEEYEKLLQFRNYSPSTIRSYSTRIRDFLISVPKDPSLISQHEIEEYYRKLSEQNKITSSFRKHFSSAIRLFFRLVLNRKVNPTLIKTKEMKEELPVVLSKDEVRLLLDTVKNLKHKTILSMIYGAGLRVSEALNLTIHDIDADQMKISVRDNSGAIDREVMLSEKLLLQLRDYYHKYKPSKYLFEGQKGNRYSARSVQQMLKKLAEKAGIHKDVTVHTLRHSFAVHLMFAGTDPKYVQKLMGHKRRSSIQAYQKIVGESVGNVRSPLDEVGI